MSLNRAPVGSVLLAAFGILVVAAGWSGTTTLAAEDPALPKAQRVEIERTLSSLREYVQTVERLRTLLERQAKRYLAQARQGTGEDRDRFQDFYRDTLSQMDRVTRQRDSLLEFIAEVDRKLKSIDDEFESQGD